KEAKAAGQRSWRRSIGAKFLALILLTLVLAVFTVVFNATNLFQKDNLNNIYVASDLLTAAKSSEIRSWLNGVFKTGEAVGRVLLAQKAGTTRPSCSKASSPTATSCRSPCMSLTPRS